jgi:DNA primase
MARVTRNCIETIRDKVNIYDVVSRVVALRKRGHDYWGLSPFTAEKTPSFKIDPDKGFFKCFSTGNAGDIFRFVEMTEQLSFSEAVETLAGRFSITLEYEHGANAALMQETRSLKRQLIELMDHATEWYHQAFMADNPLAESIRRYWIDKRKFTLEAAKRYKIGFAPIEQMQAWMTLFQQKGFDAELLQTSGLCYPLRSPTAQLRPRFRGRLMIPIRDFQGQVIAFTARKLEQTPSDDPTFEAKYVNSPETPIFHKGKTLFGLDLARQEANPNKPFIMVEGQLDTLRCREKGFLTAIAPQGTAITEEQLHLLKRYEAPLDIVLDGDSAGQNAAWRALPLVLKAGIEPRFVILPIGEDPDSFLLNHPPSVFEELLNQAIEVIPFVIQTLVPDPNPTPIQVTRAMNQLFELIQYCESEIAQTTYLQQAIHLLRLESHATLNEYQKFRWKKIRQSSTQSAQYPSETDNSKTPLTAADKRLTTREFDLLYLILQEPSLAEPVSQAIDVEWIEKTTTEGNLLARLLVEISEGLWHGPQDAETLLQNEAEKNCYYAILAEKRPFEDTVSLANNTIKQIFRSHIQQQIIECDRKLSECPENDSGYRELRVLRKNLIEARAKSPPLIQVTH